MSTRRTRKHRRLHKMRIRSGSLVAKHRLRSGRTGQAHGKKTPPKMQAEYRSVVVGGMESARLHCI